MAIDTADKRRSLSRFPFRLRPGITPNASKDAQWRLQVARSYSGIGVEAPVVQTGIVSAVLSWDTAITANIGFS